MPVSEKIRERKLERMRLGQAVCDFVPLVSDPEIRLAIVPLTEAEFLQVIEAVASIPGVDNLANMALRDRRTAQEILLRSIREPDDLTRHVYSDLEEMSTDLDVLDVDELYDRYQEMTAASSPAIDGIPPEEFEHLKKVLQEIDWNALSGRAWYAARRFLSEISQELLRVNSLGSGSITQSTTKNDAEKSTSIASPSSTGSDAKSAESQSET